MARVAIGVPVLNGGTSLAEALESLRAQTFTDFTVLISDNGSTDRTPEVAAAFVASDPRFILLRQPQTIPVLKNFRLLVDSAEAPLFMWRAHDDTSDPDFLGTLVGLMDSDQAARLAVSSVESSTASGGQRRLWRYRTRSAGTLGTLRELFDSHPSWVYGLWNRGCLLERLDAVQRGFPHVWASDHAILFPLILDHAIRGTDCSIFHQTIQPCAPSRSARKRVSSVAELARLRRDFAAFCAAGIAQREWGATDRALLALALPFYVDRRAYPWRKLMSRRLAEALGRT